MHSVTSSSLFSMFNCMQCYIYNQVCVCLFIFSVWATLRPWLSISWGICIWANWTLPILWAWRARLQKPMQTSSSRCGQAGTTQWSHVYLRWATSHGLLTTAMMITCIFFFFISFFSVFIFYWEIPRKHTLLQSCFKLYNHLTLQQSGFAWSISM